MTTPSTQILQSSIIRSVLGGNQVVKAQDEGCVIKIGAAVTEGEAITQEQVSKILDPAIIHVPRVYQFFQDDTRKIGHILMEYVEGEQIDPDNPAHIEALRKAFDHLASFKRDDPGPLHSGEPVGILWEDETPSQSHTVAGLEEWINTRQGDQVVLHGEELVLCHLDMALDNMLWLPDGKICLLD